MASDSLSLCHGVPVRSVNSYTVPLPLPLSNTKLAVNCWYKSMTQFISSEISMICDFFSV